MTARSGPIDNTKSNDNFLQAAFHIKWNHSKNSHLHQSNLKCPENSISNFIIILLKISKKIIKLKRIILYCSIIKANN